MAKWEPTPFKTLEDAHATATKFQLNPSVIIDTGRGIRSFQTKEGRQRAIIAQKIEGGPVLEKRLQKGRKSSVPLQDPSVPTFGEKDRLLTGPWIDSDHPTLEAVRAYYESLGPSTKHRISFEGQSLVIEYPNGEEAEYRQTNGSGVQQRHLFPAGHRTWLYDEPDPLRSEAEFKVGAWEQSIHKSLETVEIRWRNKFVNFNNVEVFDVKLYRIGQDEIEYVQDRNTAQVWTRLLSRVKEE